MNDWADSILFDITYPLHTQNDRIISCMERGYFFGEMVFHSVPRTQSETVIVKKAVILYLLFQHP